MTSRHLVADRYFAQLSDVDLNHFVDAGAERLCVLFLRKTFDGDDFSAGSVRDAQGCIADFTGFFAENGAQKFLFGAVIRLALRRNFTDEDIAGVDLSSDADDAVLIKVAQSVLTDVGNVAGDLFRSEFCVARVVLVLFNVN